MGYGCLKVMLDPKLQIDILTSQKANTNRVVEKYPKRVFHWIWQHQNGTKAYFEKFWSATNQTRDRHANWDWGCNCTWQPEAEVWRCNYCNNGTSKLRIVGGPLGIKDIIYYHATVDRKDWDGPFPNGTWALKGHYWICGQYAYHKLP